MLLLTLVYEVLRGSAIKRDTEFLFILAAWEKHFSPQKSTSNQKKTRKTKPKENVKNIVTEKSEIKNKTKNIFQRKIYEVMKYW